MYSLVINIFFILLIFFYIVAVFTGAPFVPTNRFAAKKMIEMAGKLKGQKVADLGSGEGRIVIAAALAGAKEVHGFEINPFLVLVTWWRVYRANLKGRVFVHWASYWGKDLSSFNTVFVYGIPRIMGRLEKKLEKELKPSAQVVSNAFTFPSWKYKKTDSKVYLYDI